MATNCGGSVETVKKNKEDKKRLRKEIKVSHTLLRHEGINTVSFPTKNLAVANGGLGNGVSREQLLHVLGQCGHVECLLMPPNKPYAFVSYGTVKDARRCQTSLGGSHLLCQGQTITLYFCFVEKVDYNYNFTCSSIELPPGLKVLEDFVTSEEETGVLESLDWVSLNNDVTAQKSLKHRKVKHYGYEFLYETNNVDKDKLLPGGLPSACDFVLEKCLKENIINIKPDQLTVNQYQPGQGIPPHVDTHSAFEDTILSLSLGAKTVMDFRHPDGRSVAVVLPRRSLLVMKGESRYLWTHGITPRKLDVVPAVGGERPGVVTCDPRDLTLSQRDTRTSFTFRKVRHTPCDCGYPSACDSQQPCWTPPAPPLPRSDTDAAQLESRFVHAVYEEIAGHFSGTRHSPWPRVAAFLRSLAPGALLLDVGCGNGKYLGVRPDVFAGKMGNWGSQRPPASPASLIYGWYTKCTLNRLQDQVDAAVGCDRSQSLMQICAERGFQAFTCDALDVPLRSSVCDACISIAVIHHFSTQERRLSAIKELIRLLKPGGRALISVWALEQEYNKQRSKYLKKTKEENGCPGKDCGTIPPPQVHAGKDVSLVQNDQTTLSVHTNRTTFSSQDLLVPWHLKGVTQKSPEPPAHLTDSVTEPTSGPILHRYYHVFCEGELEDLCRKVENVTVQSSYYDQGNWCIILEKTDA
ncbi:LOW QUALITY PROTEIN: alkylated DNA repair protein alkB homolog 8 [Brienomyrus brachyistius]|uniref:LOW QUALITY PROTEIN: alkylated DNA repair protein alkB homolog 8 n=1 Tax=Brienomyrus brachyistius TaxID=42636 RepID=UPI0020B2F088|nr:LOW QUALITY PROTEIN: alkylated DNA repair protein alkB homolog 8 [Brienomyrus brachyistius]